jgi:hypothetical protein
MKQGMLKLSSASPSAGTIAVAVLGMLGGFNLSTFGETLEPSKLIVVERELLFPDTRTEPHEVIQTPDGHFIVAGERGVVSAVAFTSNGDELWKYEEPFDIKIPGQYQSKFMGVVSFANGNLLFCGAKDVLTAQSPQRPRTHAFVTLLTSGGTLISKSIVDPRGDASASTMGFTECRPSDGGALLFGTVANSPSSDNSWRPYSRWIVIFDQNGKKRSESFGDIADDMTSPFAPPPPTSSGATFWSPPASVGDLRVTRVSETGDVTATRDVECGNFLLHVENVAPADNTAFICSPMGTKMKLIRINNELQDITPPIELEDMTLGFFNAQLGKGYRLDDGSLLIFGRMRTQKGDQATMQLFGSSGRSLSVFEFDMNYHSFKVDYVFPLGARRFLTLRQSGPEHSGLVLSWVTVKPCEC